jgi:hypothetical protein
MKLIAVRTLAVFCAAAVLFAGQAVAQPTAPGAICLIPNGWCWAESRGSSGEPCVCHTSSGPVKGTYQ